MINTYIKKKEERSQVNNLPLQLRDLDREQQSVHKTSRRNEIIKSRAGVNETEEKKLPETSVKVRVGFCFEKINKIDAPLSSLRKEKRILT